MHQVKTPALGGGRIRVALEVLEEAGLISLEEDGDTLWLRVLPAQGKADLNQTPVMRRLHEAVGSTNAGDSNEQ